MSSPPRPIYIVSSVYCFDWKTASAAPAFQLLRKRSEILVGMILPVSKAADSLDFPALPGN